MVKLNGAEQDLAGRTLADCLTEAGFNLARVAVERNGAIVPKGRYGDIVLADGDSLEVVGFVGGG